MKDWDRRRLEESKKAYAALMKFYPLTLENLDDEIWKPIPDYDGYEISNFGRVKSFKRYPQGKILKPALFSNYLRVTLFKDDERRYISVHRLVTLTFIPNLDNKPQVNHKDNNRFNNYVGNLEWVTSSENTQHALDNGLVNVPQGEECYNAKFTNEQAVYVRNNPDGLTRYELAEKFDIEPTGISAIQLGKRYKTAGGTIRKSQKPPVPVEVRAAIRAEYVYGSSEYGSSALAKKYGVCPMTILRVVNE